MRYSLNIELEELNKDSIGNLVNILQNQSEKLLRWPQVTDWGNDVLLSDGKVVGTARFTRVNAEVDPTLQKMLDTYLPVSTGLDCNPIK